MYAHTEVLHAAAHTHINRPTFPSELTPVFSSKILIPPKETVRNTFFLCSPLDRADAAIPWEWESRYMVQKNIRNSIEMHKTYKGNICKETLFKSPCKWLYNPSQTDGQQQLLLQLLMSFHLCIVFTHTWMLQSSELPELLLSHSWKSILLEHFISSTWLLLTHIISMEAARWSFIVFCYVKP